MLFYITHLYLIHALAVCVAMLLRQPVSVVAAWGLLVLRFADGLRLQPTVCVHHVGSRGFARLKQRRSEWWLS